MCSGTFESPFGQGLGHRSDRGVGGTQARSTVSSKVESGGDWRWVISSKEPRTSLRTFGGTSRHLVRELTM